MFSKFIVIFVLVSGLQEIKAGNNRPYGVSLTGFENAGKVGPGFAGSAVVAPLASEGFNSPLERHTPSSGFGGNAAGVGFGGFGWRNSQPSGYGSSGGGGSGGRGSGGSGGGY